MLIEEARWIGSQLQAMGADNAYPLCNIGSSTENFRTREQPWIDANVFAPARAGGHTVIHVDRKREPGVDRVGDLLDPAFCETLRGLGPRTILCSNLLEHVVDRPAVTRALTSMLQPGGRLIVTVPHQYPVHHDPIDNGFRPTVDELAAEFSDLRVVAGEIVTCATGWRYMRIRRSLPSMKHWSWLLRGRRYQASCVVLEASTLRA